jgi:trehalose 6-phosphate phosphatase
MTDHGDPAGPLPQPTTPDGREGLDQLLRSPESALLAFDFDGTLAPIVDDPEQAHAHPDAAAALALVAPSVGQLAIVTGRPARVAVRLGGFGDVAGLENLIVLGQYGLERWDAASGRFWSADQPEGLAVVKSRLPAVLEVLELEDAVIEDKGLAVAVHVRRVADPDKAYRWLQPALQALAVQNGLVMEHGRMVLELRPPGMDKGGALTGLAEEVDARTVMFVGDDLGDLAAFDAVEEFRAEGGFGLLVCSGSTEQTALVERSDIVVDGPSGVVDLLRALAAAL